MTTKSSGPVCTAELVSRAESASLALVPKSYDELLTEAELWKSGGTSLATPGEFCWGRELWQAVKGVIWWEYGIMVAVGAVNCLDTIARGLIVTGLYYFGLIGVGLFLRRHRYSASEKERKRRLELRREEMQAFERENPGKVIADYLESRFASEREFFLGEGSSLRNIEGMLTAHLAKAEAVRERIDLCFKQDARDSVETPEYLAAARERNQKTIARLREAEAQLRTHIARVEALFAECRERIGEQTRRYSRIDLVAEVAKMDEEAENLVAMAKEEEFASVRHIAVRLVALRETMSSALEAAGVRELASAPESGDFDRDLLSLEKAIGQLVAATP